LPKFAHTLLEALALQTMGNLFRYGLLIDNKTGKHQC